MIGTKNVKRMVCDEVAKFSENMEVRSFETVHEQKQKVIPIQVFSNNERRVKHTAEEVAKAILNKEKLDDDFVIDNKQAIELLGKPYIRILFLKLSF